MSRDGPANVSAKSESPFAFSGRYPSKDDVNHHLGDRYATVFAPTGSCARSIALPTARFDARHSGLCRLLSSPAEHRSFPTLSLQIFPRMSGPLPRLSSKVLLLVSSLGSSAFPIFGIGRLYSHTPHGDFCAGSLSRGCRHSLMFRPPGLLATQVAPTAAALFTTGQP